MKKLAPSHPFFANDAAAVRAIVDFPVPAAPLSQKMRSPSREPLEESHAEYLPSNGYHLGLQMNRTRRPQLEGVRAFGP